VGQQGRTITGLQQQGWQAEAQPQHLLDPSVLQPWNRSYMSACAAVVRPKVTTTALHNLNHFMTQSLLPLGFTSWVVCIGARGAGKHCFVGTASTWFGRNWLPATRVAFLRDHPTAVARVQTTKRFSPREGDASGRPFVLARVPYPCRRSRRYER
jgi:hypothetical protein